MTSNNSSFDSRDAINAKQRDFYESRFEVATSSKRSERAAGVFTNAWTTVRRNIQSFEEVSGLAESHLEMHREWVAPHRGGFTIDLGCFAGNPLSLELAAASTRYIGVDLSPSAIAELNDQLSELNLDHATAVAEDFFKLGLADSSVDLVYARGVLHHFEDPDEIAAEIQRVLKPGGACVSLDPLATEPVNRAARALYRPLQSDSAWEFPFQDRALNVFADRFEIAELRGIRGASKTGLVLAAAGLTDLAIKVGVAGDRLDDRLGSSDGWYLRGFCWNVMMKLVKR